MKKLIILTSLLVALMAASAGTAQADPTGNETCKGHVALSWWRYDPNQWDFNLHTSWSCNNNETFSWEYQRTTDGGLHWYDQGAGDHGHRSATCNGGCFGDLDEPGVACINSGSYRIHYWWGDGNFASASKGAGLVCAGNTFVN